MNAGLSPEIRNAKGKILMKKSHAFPIALHELPHFPRVNFCLAAVFLAVSAYAAWPGLDSAAWLRSQIENARQAKTKLPPGKSIAMKRSGAPGATKATAGSGRPSTPIPTVKKVTNAAGQTVYSISPFPLQHFPAAERAGEN